MLRRVSSFCALVFLIAFAAPAAAQAQVSFDRAFGVDVDPRRGNRRLRELHHHLPARHQQRRRRRDDVPDGVAVDAQGRILVADSVKPPDLPVHRRGRRHGQLRPRLRSQCRPRERRPGFENCTTTARPGPPAAPPAG